MRKIASIAMALVLLLAAGLPCAYALTMEGGDWYCRFTPDEAMDSNFTSLNEIDEVLSGLQPGDDAIFHIELENQHEQSTDWYMTNRVLKSLEATRNAAAGGAYSYDLRYMGPDGEDILFTSDSVGGEEKTLADREGLREATSALEDFFYLDTLNNGEKGNITLKVALEGETQGNAYQDTLADLQMDFAVELNNTTPDSPDATPGNPGPWTPVRTGDESNLLLWSGVMLVCGLGALGLAVYSLRRNRKQREDNRDE